MVAGLLKQCVQGDVPSGIRAVASVGLRRVGTQGVGNWQRMPIPRPVMTLADDQRYRLVMEAAADAIVIIDQTDNVIVEVNRQAERMWGCPADQLVGRPRGFISTQSSAVVRTAGDARHPGARYRLRLGDYDYRGNRAGGGESVRP